MASGGFQGQPKGVNKQIMWERGLWEEWMTLETAKPVLEKCPDFLHEKPKLQLQVEERGHILELSPKGHPEMAGAGIECVWCKTKCEWRRMPVEKRNTKNFMADSLIGRSTCRHFGFSIDTRLTEQFRAGYYD